jgi:hypothetical protein
MAPRCNSVQGAKTMQAQQRDIINVQGGAILKMLTTSGVHLLNVLLTVRKRQFRKCFDLQFRGNSVISNNTCCSFICVPFLLHFTSVSNIRRTIGRAPILFNESRGKNKVNKDDLTCVKLIAVSVARWRGWQEHDYCETCAAHQKYFQITVPPAALIYLQYMLVYVGSFKRKYILPS